MVTKSEADGQHPASHYLVVEDAAKPSTWHLRVKDASGKADHTLMGAAWAALHGGYRGNKYAGPNKAEALRKLIALYKSEGMPTPGAAMAAFAVELASSDERRGVWVIRHGKLFEAGDYPDKRFAMTPDELAQAVQTFQPVPLDSEHRESVFDGHLGQVEAIELCDGGQAICGAVAIPDWLDTLFDGYPIPVSTTWDRETKTLMGLALAKHPRVSDAAILAAFARHDTWEGRGTLQGIHDMAARAGATCQPPAGQTGMNSSHENQGIQAIHDMASQHGARCSAMGDRYASYVDTFAAFAGRRNAASDQDALDAAHEAIVKAGANCAGATMSEEHPIMDRAKRFFAWLSGEADSPIDEADQETETTTTATTAAELPNDDRIKAIETQLADERRLRVQQQAAAFADGAVRDRRALPAERQSLYDAYLMAATDDAAHGAVTFADGQEGTRVSRLEAMVTARPQHSLTVEAIQTNEGGALGDGAKAAMSDERKNALLAMTPAGQAALDARRRAKSA